MKNELLSAGNKIIADFIGEETEFSEVFKDWQIVKRHAGDVCRKNPDGKTFFTINYFTSWDALLPVCKKIQKMFIRGEVRNNELKEDLRGAIVSIDLENTWKAVYNFLEWFNKLDTK